MFGKGVPVSNLPAVTIVQNYITPSVNKVGKLLPALIVTGSKFTPAIGVSLLAIAVFSCVYISAICS